MFSKGIQYFHRRYICIHYQNAYCASSGMLSGRRRLSYLFVSAMVNFDTSARNTLTYWHRFVIQVVPRWQEKGQWIWCYWWRRQERKMNLQPKIWYIWLVNVCSLSISWCFFSFLKSVEYEVKCVLYRFKIFYSYEVECFERIKSMWIFFLIAKRGWTVMNS